MTRTVQIRISKEEIDAIIKNFIYKRVSEIIKKQKIDRQIAIEIDQATIEVLSIDYEERIRRLEEKVYGEKHN